jgi:hypothetical protein
MSKRKFGDSLLRTELPVLRVPWCSVVLEKLVVKDDSFLGRCTVQSGTSLPSFQRYLLPPSSGR